MANFLHQEADFEHNNQFYFQPATLVIKVGDEVVWVNDSDTNHLVVSNTAGIFNSYLIPTNHSFWVILDRVNTYAYHDNIFLSMKGTIYVTS